MPAVAGDHLQLLPRIGAVQVNRDVLLACGNAGHRGQGTTFVNHQWTGSAGVRIVEQHGRDVSRACQRTGLVADTRVGAAGVFRVFDDAKASRRSDAHRIVNHHFDTPGSRAGGGVNGKQIASRVAIAVNTFAMNGIDLTNDRVGEKIQRIAGAA